MQKYQRGQRELTFVEVVPDRIHLAQREGEQVAQRGGMPISALRGKSWERLMY